MSFSKSPRLNDARRREDAADARRTATIIGAVLALAAFSFIGGITLMVWK